GKLLATMLLLYAVVEVMESVSYGLQAELLLRIQAHEGYTMAEAELNDFRVRALSVVALILFLTTAIAFCTFVFRANRNARAFGAVGMKFTPGWSVGYFFVPLA